MNKDFNPFMPLPPAKAIKRSRSLSPEPSPPLKLIKKSKSTSSSQSKRCSRTWICGKNRARCSSCGKYSIFMAVKHTPDGDSCCFICGEDCVYLYLCRYRIRLGCHSEPVPYDDDSLNELDDKRDL